MHPHQVTGTIPPPAPLMSDDGKTSLARSVGTESHIAATHPSAEPTLQLVSLEGKAERLVWTFRPQSSGEFIVANVPHGRYRVQVSKPNVKTGARSLAFDVGDGESETTVRWSSLRD